MLDEDQKQVVEAGEGPYAVLASPGCGKSTVILHRAARLSEKSDNVLTVTFTSEAASNLRTRCAKLFPSSKAEFRTLHSLALKFANEHPDSFPFPLSDNPLAGEGIAMKAAFQATKNQINFRVFTSFVSLQKRNRITPVEAIRTAECSGQDLDKALAYKEYQRLLKNQGVLDFDDLIYYCVEILESRPDIRSKMQVEYLQQDEAQDACELDWRMLQLMSQKHKNVLAVGDPAQNLFSFRGSSSEHLLHMEDLFPGTKKLYMGSNYRSTKSIVSYVKNAAPFAEISEHFEAVSTEQGPEPVITGYSTDFMEAEGVVNKIALLPPNDCAVLARTNIALRAIEESLIERNVPYYLLNEDGFWDLEEVRSMLAWIRCVQAPVDNFLLAALQTPFWPTQFIKRKLVAQEIREQITKQGKTAWVLLSNYRSRDDRQNQAVKKFVDFVRKVYGYRGLPAREVVGNLLRDLKAIDHYKEESGICPDKDPVASLRELLRVSEKKDSLPDFLSYVRKVMGANRSRKGVVLSTIHSFKGKEAKHVSLISVNQGVLPHSKAITPEDILGEKCCYYVGCSRAEKTLNISYWGAKSSFLTNS
jgi:superfamily I DNA/RNA helicase